MEEDENTRQGFSFSYLATAVWFRIQLLKKSPTFDTIKSRVGIRAMEIETAQIHFLGDVALAFHYLSAM